MTFSVRLASNDKPRPPARADADVVKPSNPLGEFCQGVSFGAGLLVALVIAYWAANEIAVAVPGLQLFQAHWLNLR